MGSRLSYKMPSVSRHSLHTLRAPLCAAVKVKVKVKIIEKAVRKKAHCLSTHISHGGHTTARHGAGDRSGYGSGFVTVTRHTSNHFPILLHQSAYSIHLFPPFVKNFFHTFPEKSGERGGAFCGALLERRAPHPPRTFKTHLLSCSESEPVVFRLYFSQLASYSSSVVSSPSRAFRSSSSTMHSNFSPQLGQRRFSGSMEESKLMTSPQEGQTTSK